MCQSGGCCLLQCSIVHSKRHAIRNTKTFFQIEFLEVRLAEVMAYADIPPHMRPALTDMTSASGGEQRIGPGSLLAASLSANAAAGARVGAAGVGASVQTLEQLHTSLAQTLERLQRVGADAGTRPRALAPARNQLALRNTHA